MTARCRRVVLGSGLGLYLLGLGFATGIAWSGSDSTASGRRSCTNTKSGHGGSRTLG